MLIQLAPSLPVPPPWRRPSVPPRRVPAEPGRLRRRAAQIPPLRHPQISPPPILANTAPTGLEIFSANERLVLLPFSPGLPSFAENLRKSTRILPPCARTTWERVGFGKTRFSERGRVPCASRRVGGWQISALASYAGLLTLPDFLHSADAKVGASAENSLNSMQIGGVLICRAVDGNWMRSHAWCQDLLILLKLRKIHRCRESQVFPQVARSE